MALDSAPEKIEIQPGYVVPGSTFQVEKIQPAGIEWTEKISVGCYLLSVIRI